ncbi:MAG: helix-turn-helix domain-containing protein [Hyphomicrobiaceae bacterium]|nr:helix-turn-helix domain-containing protein [Hyphomicrobiaceae bacterium]
MSIRLMSVVWEVPFPTATQMLICLKLADYANDHGGSIFPANSTLADKARCSESTVKVTIKALRACGLLYLVRAGGNGPRDTNEWMLNVPMLKALADGTATMSGCSDTLEIDGFEGEVSNVQDYENKGSEKGSKTDPLSGVRGQSGELRGQPTGAKGSAGKPQSTNNHHLDSSGAPKRASDKGARAPGAQANPRPSQMIAKADCPSEYEAWLEHYRKYGTKGQVKFFEDHGQVLAPTMWPPGHEGKRGKMAAAGAD